MVDERKNAWCYINISFDYCVKTCKHPRFGFCKTISGSRDLLVKTVRERRHTWNSELDLGEKKLVVTSLDSSQEETRWGKKNGAINILSRFLFTQGGGWNSSLRTGALLGDNGNTFPSLVRDIQREPGCHGDTGGRVETVTPGEAWAALWGSRSEPRRSGVALTPPWPPQGAVDRKGVC